VIANLLTAETFVFVCSLLFFLVFLNYNRIYAVIVKFVIFLYNCYRVYAVIL
jgi:hypothetical protein